jgi:trimeric autotransporter adhesin
VKQDVAVWTGAISKNWHVAGNWSNGHIPSEKTHVIIDGAATNPCEMTDNDGTAASVQMRSGGSIKLLNGHKLLVAATCNPLPPAP